MTARTRAQYKDKANFGGNREAAILRDGEKCIRCGMTRSQHKEKYGRDITVDHIDGNGRDTPIERQNNDMSNLETLCLTCHGKKDIQRRKTFGRWENGGLSAKQISEIRVLLENRVFQSEIAKIYNVSRPTISKINTGTGSAGYARSADLILKDCVECGRKTNGTYCSPKCWRKPSRKLAPIAPKTKSKRR